MIGGCATVPPDPPTVHRPLSRDHAVRDRRQAPEAQRRSTGSEIDRLEAENKLFFVRVRNGYKTLANEDPTRFRMIQVDGLSIEEVHKKVVEIIQEKISDHG